LCRMMQFLLVTVQEASTAASHDANVDIVDTLNRRMHHNMRLVLASGASNDVSLHVNCFTWALLTFFLQAQKIANRIFVGTARKVVEELCQMEILLRYRFPSLCRGTDYALRTLWILILILVLTVNQFVPVLHVVASLAGGLQECITRLPGLY
jgi:hypothetical protein